MICEIGVQRPSERRRHGPAGSARLRRVRRGGVASCLARLGVAARSVVGLAGLRLQAAADGAALVVVVGERVA
eukprot:scaffold113156_cov72-Phaeocystis_antarctica.AAC.2